jgi:hypothetical protein
MSRPASVRIDRLVIDGGGLSRVQIREAARAMAEQLSQSWHGAPSVSREHVTVTLDDAGTMATAPLARQMADAVRRAIG